MDKPASQSRDDAAFKDELGRPPGRKLVTIRGKTLGIAPAEWAAMLRDACAPEPWAVADAPQRFAAEITFREPARHTRPRSAEDRAWKAVAELRHVLPGIVAERERWVAACDRGTFATVLDPSGNWVPGLPDLAAGMRQAVLRELEEWRRLLLALPEPHKAERLQQPWHYDALRLYQRYLRYVDPEAGVSAAAVRFVALGLERMGSRSPRTGHEDELRAAVERVLQRWRMHTTRP